MKIEFVDLHRQYLSIKQEIDEAIADVITNSAFIGGEAIKQFEQNFSELFDNQNVVACANGTDSLEIILQAKGIGKGDEIIIPALTWISTAEAVITAGATPVFVDVDDEGLINIAEIKKAITKNTKAIIPVHLYGKPVNMEKLMTLANQYKIFVLEDCAQAHLAKWNGKKIGTFGQAASFSFFPGKNLGAYGDAGAMMLQDKTLADDCRMIAQHGQKGKHNHIISGRNSRLDGLQAAILNVKIKHLQKWTEQRQTVAKQYDNLLQEVSQIKLPQIPKEGSCVYHLYAIEAENRDELKNYLTEKGISTAVHYPLPLTRTQPFKQQKSFPNAERITERTLSMPIFAEMEEIEVEYVADAIKAFYK